MVSAKREKVQVPVYFSMAELQTMARMIFRLRSLVVFNGEDQGLADLVLERIKVVEAYWQAKASAEVVEEVEMVAVRGQASPSGEHGQDTGASKGKRRKKEKIMV